MSFEKLVWLRTICGSGMVFGMVAVAIADQPTSSTADASSETPPHAIIDGSGPGWVPLDEDDFVRVNGDDQTLVWDGTLARGSGQPIGVTRSIKSYKNFEYVLWWRHLTDGGNSGTFVWVPMSAMEGLKPGQLPRGGIEIQMLDHGFTEKWKAKHPDREVFFSTNGDVFPVGESTMTPFEPLSPNGQRSFPSQDRTHGHGVWNHYYVRAINGEVRLWINGREVSGGRDCQPSKGHLCLESEGAPIEFRDIRVRELP